VAYQPDFDRLLRQGSTYVDEKGVRYVIEAQPLDPVHLPTGQVVGCDPLVFDDSGPFRVRVNPGTYPLRAWVAVLYRDGVEEQRRTAALQLVIRDQPAVRWEPALVGEQDSSKLGDDEFYGYGVDAGAGTLADLVAVRALAEWDYDRLDEVYIPAQLPPAPAAINAVTDADTGANVVAVTSGWGDGVYPTFIGYTAAGDVATFVTDFMVVPRDE